ncbi:MAG: SDR family NAD(P)-dependent oxidoreductase [Gammaproteobacteria bacterium]
MKLSGKLGIVTGGGSGIGRAIAERIVAEGGSVLITGRREDVLAQAAGEIDPQKVHPCVADVRRPAEATRTVEAAIKTLGGLHFLVNNAGVVVTKNSHDVSEAEFDLEIGTNLKGAFFMAQAAIRHFRGQRSGAILNIGSAAGIVATPKMAAYGASKAALIHMTQTLALEYAKEGIRCNCISPGTVDTGIIPKALATLLVSRHPLGRLGTPQEVAALAVQVLADESAWMTGSSLVLDGGVSL